MKLGELELPNNRGWFTLCTLDSQKFNKVFHKLWCDNENSCLISGSLKFSVLTPCFCLPFKLSLNYAIANYCWIWHFFRLIFLALPYKSKNLSFTKLFDRWMHLYFCWWCFGEFNFVKRCAIRKQGFFCLL